MGSSERGRRLRAMRGGTAGRFIPPASLDDAEIEVMRLTNMKKSIEGSLRRINDDVLAGKGDTAHANPAQRGPLAYKIQKLDERLRLLRRWMATEFEKQNVKEATGEAFVITDTQSLVLAGYKLLLKLAEEVKEAKGAVPRGTWPIINLYKDFLFREGKFHRRG